MANSKLEILCKEWVNSHSLHYGERYTLRYKSKKSRYFESPNYLEKYYVTSKGKVYKRIKKSSLYQEVTYYVSIDMRKHRITPSYNIRVKINGKLIQLNRLVATIWVRNLKPDLYNIVMHLDNNKFNNSSKNLQWGTQSMNICQARDEGRLPTLFVSGPTNPSFGKRFSKLDIEMENSLISDIKSGKFTRVELSKMYKVSRATINNILKRKGLYYVK